MGSYDDNAAAALPIADTVGWDQLFAALRRRAAVLVAVPTVVAALALAASYLVEPRYRVETVLIPQQEGQQQGLLGSLMGQFGGVAALAGVDLGGSMNKFEAIGVLRSTVADRGAHQWPKIATRAVPEGLGCRPAAVEAG